MKMKTSRIYLFTLLSYLLFFLNSCSDDDILNPVNEEELITTVILTFQPVGAGSPVEYRFTDLDGDGGAAPEISVQGNLLNFQDYNLSIRFLNESVNPFEEITEEINIENTAHQVFFIVESSLDLNISYNDTDLNGKPLGLANQVRTGGSSNGRLTVVLRHDLNKNAGGVEQGDITNAGGDTDAEVTFDVVINN